MKITEAEITEHGLSKEEYARIIELMGREPNMTELGVFSVMWSEHCSYKSSKKHLSGFPTEGEHVLQGPGENAGIVDIGDNLAACFKMESHNHPSFIEPYQGAATGVGGILRDVFTMGARPVALLNSLRFGSPDHPKTKYLLDGVVEGIAGYGNCMGVPTIAGEVYFHESYNGNCLVNAMTVGIVKHDKIFRGFASGVGNPVLYVGSSTGRDGIHGATMASDVFGEGGEERRPTVQVGDPFTEKLLLEACLEVFKTDHIVGIQDMGAAGLTSSSVEMAGRSGTGIEIDVAKVPRREQGMTPYEVLLSESQERMLLVVKQGREQAVMDIYKKWDLEASVIGKVTDTGMIRILDDGELAAEMPIPALTDEAPMYDRPYARPTWQDEVQTLDLNEVPLPHDMSKVLLTLLSSLNIASKSWIYEQYDHMVRTDTVIRPGADSALLRIKGTNKALAMTVDCNSRYVYLDPETGAKIAVAEAARNLSAVGATPLAVTDCLNFGNPERPDVMWQFVEAVKGLKKACIALETPVIGGNVSFYNETSGTAIYPTPTIGMVGLIEDISKHTTPWFKDDGDVIALLGETLEEIGGSEYLKTMYGLDKGMPPEINLLKEKAVQLTCRRAITSGIIKSAHDVSEGGIAVTIAESCFNPAGTVGAEVNIPNEAGIRTDALLFGETQSRIVVSFSESDTELVRKVAESFGAPFIVIGTVVNKTDSRGRPSNALQINDLAFSITELESRWKGALENFAE